MHREDMIRFVVFVLRTHEGARIWGGLRSEAEDIVDLWISQNKDAA